MSYIPARAMRRARPADTAGDSPSATGWGAWARLTAAAERVSPRTWTIGAFAAGAVAIGALVTARAR